MMQRTRASRRKRRRNPDKNNFFPSVAGHPGRRCKPSENSERIFFRLASLVFTLVVLGGCGTHISHVHFPATPRAGSNVVYVKKYDYRFRPIHGTEHRLLGSFKVLMPEGPVEYLPGFAPRSGRGRSVFDSSEQRYFVQEEGNSGLSDIVVEAEDGSKRVIGVPGLRYLDRIALCTEMGRNYVFIVEDIGERVDRIVLWRICLGGGDEGRDSIEIDFDGFLKGYWVKDLSCSGSRFLYLVVHSKNATRTIEFDFEVGRMRRSYEGEYYSIGRVLVSPNVAGSGVGPVKHLRGIRDGQPIRIPLPVTVGSKATVRPLSGLDAIYVGYGENGECGVLIDSRGEVIAVFGQE